MGARLDVIGIPPSLRGFVNLLRPFDEQLRVVVVPGQILVNTPSNPAFTIRSVQAAITLTPAAGAPRFEFQADGSATGTSSTKDGLRSQVLMPAFAACDGFLDTARQFPGVTEAVPVPDGKVLVTFGGQTLRLKPSFTVSRGGSTTQRQIVLGDAGGPTFDLGDGRRQRFTVVP